MLAMKLLLCKTLWGHSGSVEQAAQLAMDAGFGGIEAPVPIDTPAVEHFAKVLQAHGLAWIR